MATITLYQDEGTGYSYEKYANKIPGLDWRGFKNEIRYRDGYPKTDLSPTRFSKLFVTYKPTSRAIPDYYYKVIYTGSNFKSTLAGSFGDHGVTQGSISGIKFLNNHTTKGGPVITIKDINFKFLQPTWANATAKPAPISVSWLPGELIDENQTILSLSDTINGSSGGDKFSGFNGDDTMYGNRGDDVLNGNKGDDILFGGQGWDRLYGGKDDDILYGGKGNDILNGNNNNDYIYGEAGDDLIRGGKDDDHLYGGAGNDTLYGDKGNDDLNGGEGADIFRFLPNGGEDYIEDFNPAEGDKIQIFKGLKYSYNGSDEITFENSNNYVLLWSDTDISDSISTFG